MKHIFKASVSGAYKTKDSVAYDCKCVNSSDKLPKGWCNSLEQALKVAKKSAVKEPESISTQAELEG